MPPHAAFRVFVLASLMGCGIIGLEDISADTADAGGEPDANVSDAPITTDGGNDAAADVGLDGQSGPDIGPADIGPADVGNDVLDAGPASPCRDTRGLISWITFDMEGPNGSFLDESGNSLHAECTGGVCGSAIAGAVGLGRAFRAAQQEHYRLRQDDDEPIQPPGDFTAAAFFQSGTTSADATIFSKSEPGGTDVDWWLGLNEARTEIQFWSSNTAFSLRVPFSQMDTLSHVALVWEAETGTAIVYLDGAEAGRVADLSLTLGPGDLILGGWQTGVDTFAEHWEGTLDEMRIYSDALDADQIAAIASCR